MERDDLYEEYRRSKERGDSGSVYDEYQKQQRSPNADLPTLAPVVVDQDPSFGAQFDRLLNRNAHGQINDKVGPMSKNLAAIIDQKRARNDLDIPLTPARAKARSERMHDGTLPTVTVTAKRTGGLASSIAGVVNATRTGSGPTSADEARMRALGALPQPKDAYTEAEHNKRWQELLAIETDPVLTAEQRNEARNTRLQLQAQHDALKDQVKGHGLAAALDALTLGAYSRPERQAFEKMVAENKLVTPEDVTAAGASASPRSTVPDISHEQMVGSMIGTLPLFIGGEALVGRGALGLADALGEGSMLARGASKALRFPYGANTAESALGDVLQTGAKGALQGQVTGTAIEAARAAGDERDVSDAVKESLIANAEMGAGFSLAHRMGIGPGTHPFRVNPELDNILGPLAGVREDAERIGRAAEKAGERAATIGGEARTARVAEKADAAGELAGRVRPNETPTARVPLAANLRDLLAETAPATTSPLAEGVGPALTPRRAKEQQLRSAAELAMERTNPTERPPIIPGEPEPLTGARMLLAEHDLTQRVVPDPPVEVAARPTPDPTPLPEPEPEPPLVSDPPVKLTTVQTSKPVETMTPSELGEVATHIRRRMTELTSRSDAESPENQRNVKALQADYDAVRRLRQIGVEAPSPEPTEPTDFPSEMRSLRQRYRDKLPPKEQIVAAAKKYGVPLTAAFAAYQAAQEATDDPDDSKLAAAGVGLAGMFIAPAHIERRPGALTADGRVRYDHFLDYITERMANDPRAAIPLRGSEEGVAGLVHRNSRPDEKPWRVTAYVDGEEGASPFAHYDYDSLEEALNLGLMEMHAGGTDLIPEGWDEFQKAQRAPEPARGMGGRDFLAPEGAETNTIDRLAREKGVTTRDMVEGLGSEGRPTRGTTNVIERPVANDGGLLGEGHGFVPQEAASYGRHGYVPDSKSMPKEWVKRLTEDVTKALHDDDGNNLVAQIVARRHGLSTPPRVTQGEGRYEGDTNPNSVFHFEADAPDEALATTAAIQGLLLGQDAAVWVRHVPDGTEGSAPGHVITGPDAGKLSRETIEHLAGIIDADPMFAPLAAGSTATDGHIIFRNFDPSVPDEHYAALLDEALGRVTTAADVERHVGAFTGDYLDGPRKYLEVIGRDPDAIREARRILAERVAPVYERFADEAGVGDQTRAALESRTKGLEALARQQENAPLQSNGRGKAMVQAARELAAAYRAIPKDAPPHVVRRTLVREATKAVRDFISHAPDAERAADWYGSEIGDQEAITTLVIPELRRPAMRTLYHMVTSIVSNGAQVRNEHEAGTNIFDQFIRTGQLTKRDPNGPVGLAGKDRPMGRGIGGEPIRGSHHEPAHEAGLRRLQELIGEMGVDDLAKYLVSERTFKSGPRKGQPLPASVEEFGQKIGQYFRDKLGLPEEGGSTIDSWMYRLHNLWLGRTKEGPLRQKKGVDERGKPRYENHPTEKDLDDTVAPEESQMMQDVMRAVAAKLSGETGLSVKASAVQAMLWYHVKRLFRAVGATEKPGAYDTLGSAAMEYVSDPPWKGPAKKAAGALAGAAVLGAATAGEAEAEDGTDRPMDTGTRVALGAAGLVGAALLARAGAGAVAEAAGKQLPANPARPIIEAVKGAMDTPGGRVAAGAAAAGLGALLATADEEKHPELQRTGAPLMALGLLSAIGSGNMGKLGGSASRALVSELAKTDKGRALVRYVNPDALLDGQTKQVIKQLHEDQSFAQARAAEWSGKLGKLSPEADRLVSDLRERETWEDVTKMSPDDINAAAMMVAALNHELDQMSAAALQAGVISPEQFLKHAGTYMKRVYGEHEALRLQKEPPIRGRPGGGRGISAPGVKRRTLDDIRDPVERRRVREQLGEIRESSYRAPLSIEETYRNVAAMKALGALKQIPGNVHPEFVAQHDALQTARDDWSQAKTQAQKDAAQQRIDAAKGELARVATRYEASRGEEWVSLPNSKSYGDLRGAVVSRDIYHQLKGLPDRGAVGKAMRFWKQNKTVFNPGTHVGNVMSNTVMAHMAGLPLWQQGEYLIRAGRDIKSYGPATRALTELGVLDVNAINDAGVGGQDARQTTSMENLSRLKETTRPETRAALEYRNVPDEPGALRRGATRAKRLARDAYNTEDNIFRVAMYTKAMEPKAEGGFGMSSAEAAEYARTSLIDFRSNSPALNDVRNTVSPFVLYPAKAIPTFAKHVVDHPWRYITLMAGWGALHEYSRQEEGPINERDVPPKDRRDYGYILPGMTQLPFTGSKGQKYAFDLSRWTPLSFMTGGAPPGSPGAQISDDWPGGLTASSPWTSLTSKLVGNVDPYTGKEVFSSSKTPAQNAGTLGSILYDEVAPPVVGFQARRLSTDIQNREWPAVQNDALGLLGLKPRLTRPNEYPRQAMFEAEQDRREVTQDIRRRWRRAQNNPEQVKKLVAEYQERMRLIDKREQERLMLDTGGR